MPKRTTRTYVSLDCKIENENNRVGVVDVASSSRLRRRLLYLNRNPDDRTNSISNTVTSPTNKAPFLRTGLMWCVKRNGECNSNCCERKISESGNNNANSTHQIHSIGATQKQHNCNVNVANNSIPHIYEIYPKDKAECNGAADNGSSTDQVNTIAPIEQVNNIGPHSSVCNSHEVKLPVIRLACGDGEVNLPCKELDCIGEPEPLLSTQDLVLESAQNGDELSEIQWDCQSLELAREVKQLQGHYGIEEIRKVVANFSDTDVELHKHIIPELMLYSPVKSNGVLTRTRQKAKVRAGIRLQRKAYGRESAEEILKWLQNKAAEQMPGGFLEKTAALETLESLQACSYMTPSVSAVQVDDLNGNIPDGASRIPLEDDETPTCQSNSIATPVAALSSVAYTQVLDLSKENIAVLKTLDTYQIQSVNIPDGIFEKLQEVDKVLDDQASTVSTSASAPPKKTASMEAALNSLHVHSDVTPSVSATEDDAFDVSFSDDDCQMLLNVDQALDSQASTDSTLASAPPKPTASMEAALNSLHVQSATTSSVSATEDDAFNVSFSDDDCQMLLNVDQALDSQASTVSTSASAPPKPTASMEAALNSLHVQSATTSSVSATEDDAFNVSFSDDDCQMLLNVDQALDSQASTVSTSASAPPKPTASMEAALNSLHVQSATTSSVSETEDDAFNVSFSDDDDFHQLLKVDDTLDSQTHTVSTSKSVALETLKTQHVQSSMILYVSASCDDFNVNIYDECHMLLETAAPPKKTASMEAALNSLHVQSAMTSSVSATEDDAFDVSFSDDDCQLLLDIDQALDSQASTVSTSASKPTASMEATLNSLHVQSAMTPSVSATEDDAFFVSFCGDDCHKLLEVDETLDSQNHHSTSISAPPKKTAADEVALNSLQVQPAMTSSVSATEDDDFDVSFSDDDFHQLFEVDETLDSQVSTISTLKSMACETLKSLKAQSEMILGVSASHDDFNVSISDNELSMLLDDDDESLGYQAGSILTSKAGPSKETAAVVAKLNPLDVQSHTTASVSTTEDHDFNVSIPDDHGLLAVGETLDRQANSISDNELPILLDDDATLDRQANSISSSRTGLPEKTAAVGSMTHQVLSDVIENVSRGPDDDYDVSDSQLLLEVNEILDKHANILSSSAANSLHEKTVAVETSFKTLRIQSDMIQNVSVTHDEFTWSIPDDDFEQMLEVYEVLASQTNILSASTPADLQEKTAEVGTLETLQVQSDLRQSFSMTQEFDNICDDDFEQMLEVDEVLDSQTNILSASTAHDLPEKTGKVETLETLQIQSDMRQSFSMTQEFDNICDDDFEQMLEVDEVLDSQTNILSASTAHDLPEKTGKVETLETLQIQSDMRQSFSMTQEFDHICDDDFEPMLEVDEALDSQTNILSASTAADLQEKTAEVGTLETLQIQSDLIQSISVTPVEDANFPEDDLEYLLDIRETLDSQANILSTAAAVGSGVTHRPASGLHNEITSACTIFDTGQIQRPSTSKNDDVIKKLPEANENLHNQAGSISTSVTARPGVAFTPVSDHLKTSLSETSPKTSHMLTSVNMKISKLANITNADTNHEVFTSDSKQLSFSKLTESLSSSRAVNNSPSNVNSLRRFRFKRITCLQTSSYPYASMHRSFLPHFSRMCRSVKWSDRSSLSSNEVMLNPVETLKCSQARCSLEEIEQKRRAALLKRSLRLGQL